MTFKDATFDQSPTMRALARTASEKGWIKPELTKIAAPHIDLQPSVNLTENVLKLCAGLRQSGMEKLAIELEDKFIVYKQATNSLYDVSNETGEDVINAAHPGGGHTMEGLEGDAHVETVIEKKLKMLEVVNKKPTGKLSSAHDIINSVKLVLAEEKVEDLEDQIKKYVQAAYVKAEKIRERFNKDLTIPVTTSLGDAVLENQTLDNIQQAKTYFNRMVSRAKPGLLGGTSQDSWSIMQDAISDVQQYLDHALALKERANAIRGKYYQGGDGLNVEEKTETPAKPVETIPLTDEAKQYLRSVNGYLAQLSSFLVVINNDPENNAEDKKNAGAWIAQKAATLSKLKNAFTALDATEQNNQASGYLIALNKNVKDINQFKNQWIG